MNLIYLLLVPISYMYPYTLLSFIAGLIVGSHRQILEWFRDNVYDQRYGNLIDKLLQSIGSMDVEETGELLIDFIYFVRGTIRYRPIRYVGDSFICPISRLDTGTGDMVLILPCGHKGRYENMKEWIESNPTCPECRHPC